MGEGIVTLANMKISAIDGIAFVDFGIAGPLTDNVDRLLKIYDSQRRAITGRIYRAGTGETLSGIEKFPDKLFNTTDFGDGTPTNWTLVRGTSTKNITDMMEGDACVQVSNPAGNSGVIIPTFGGGSISLTTKALYKIYFNLKTKAGSGGYFVDLGGGSYIPTTNSTGLWVVTTLYKTIGAIASIDPALYATPDAIALTNSILMDNCLLQQVLTPSATGVTIVSEDMATRNWTSKHASFNYNDPAGYTFDFEQEIRGGIGRGRLVAIMRGRR